MIARPFGGCVDTISARIAASRDELRRLATMEANLKVEVASLERVARDKDVLEGLTPCLLPGCACRAKCRMFPEPLPRSSAGGGDV